MLGLDAREYRLASATGMLERSVRHPLRDTWNTAFHSVLDIARFAAARALEQRIVDPVARLAFCDALLDELCFLRDAQPQTDEEFFEDPGEVISDLTYQVSEVGVLGLSDAPLQEFIAIALWRILGCIEMAKVSRPDAPLDTWPAKSPAA